MNLFTKCLVITALSALPAAAAPDWWVALHGSYLTADELAQVTFPQACPAGYSCAPVNGGLTAQIPDSVAQVAAPVVQAALATASKITYSPDLIVSAGGGFASPNGKFGYYSVSKYIGQSTYATMANQYRFVGGKLESCALAGLTKEMYQFGWLIFGITGLGGGCEGFAGNAGAAASAQAFAHVHFGKSPIGVALTGMKTTSPGFQVTIAPTWGR